ncbi:MAG: FHA domain-containing protein [Planctomycetota bacterium]
MELQLHIKSDLPPSSYPEKYFDLTTFFSKNVSNKLWIGRDSDCDLRIYNKEISRQHCYIEQISEDKLKLVDNKSRNGCFINRIQRAEAILNEGDSIVIGPYELVLSARGGSAVGTEAPAGDCIRQKKEVSPDTPNQYIQQITPSQEKQGIRQQKIFQPNTPFIALTAAFIIVMVVFLWVFVLKSQDNKKIIRPTTSRETIKPVISSSGKMITPSSVTSIESVSKTDTTNKFLTAEDLTRKTIEEFERQKQALKTQREQEGKEYQAKLKSEKEKEDALKRQQEEGQRMIEEKIRWGENKIKIVFYLTKYQYTKALDLLNDFLKEIKTENIKTEVNGYMEDLKGEYSLFQNMLNNVSTSQSHKKIMVDNRVVWVTKADENGFEGSIAGLSGSVYKRQWVDIPSEVFLDLFPGDLVKLERFYLATFCYNHNLLKEGQRILVSCLRLYPDEKWRVDGFLARYKDIPIPEGGFYEYKGKLVTAEEKAQIEIREKAEKEERERKIAELKKQIAPKGVINKPGADIEKLPWEQARITETAHYIVQANLSQEALNDICYVMECFYIEAKSIFKLSQESQNKLKVYMFKEGKEYYDRGGYRNGMYFGDRLMTFYHPSTNPKSQNTTTILLHEGIHQFIALVCNAQVPAWINEGLATYYESSKFEGTFLKTNIVNYSRLSLIRDLIKKKDVPRLGDFINIRQINFSMYDYAHSWSLVYFFMNYNKGQYADELENYFEAIKQTGFENRPQHKQLFEDAFKVKFEVLEKEWEDYIMQLR